MGKDSEKTEVIKNIAVIGAGSWGTTLAILLAQKGYDVSLWVYEEELAQQINRTRINRDFLDGFTIPEGIEVSSNKGDVLRHAECIINAVPTQYIRNVFKDAVPFIPRNVRIVSVSKGIERGTLMTSSAILRELTGKEVAVLSGPSFAKEVMKRLPTAVTVASNESDTGLFFQRMFNTEYFRVYTHDDVLGVEIGGALKNVIAIASGISDALRLGFNARAALITRGLAEITRLGIAMGAKEETFRGLSALGDLVLTCTGPLSRNYTVGFKLGQGQRLSDILSGMNMVAEGVSTAESAYELSRRYNVEMPIIREIYKVINEGKNPSDAVRELMTRALKSEF
jgi:glycerol-3-phosphate dehydrogenase (NAD(P)+)